MATLRSRLQVLMEELASKVGRNFLKDGGSSDNQKPNV